MGEKQAARRGILYREIADDLVHDLRLAIVTVLDHHHFHRHQLLMVCPSVDDAICPLANNLTDRQVVCFLVSDEVLLPQVIHVEYCSWCHSSLDYTCPGVQPLKKNPAQG